MNKDKEPVNPHHFHIPVMGLAFTVDTPIKVAKYGIDSVVSVIENKMLEHLRKKISAQYSMAYSPIDESIEDYKAKRITAYLNLLNNVVEIQFNKMLEGNFETNVELNNYFKFLPDDSLLKETYQNLKFSSGDEKIKLEALLKSQMKPGSIDINIMTKVDKLNYSKNNEPLPVEFSDALTCLRGYANSDLTSSVVLSAGINPRLYSYFETFSDFYPDSYGNLKKKIIVKVSDYRSALIQGKFLAKKGLWVSEFRIESGLNCGGHAFATEGILLGPILEEFKLNKNNLIEELFTIVNKALETNGKKTFAQKPNLRITAQGGVGTSEEASFLIENYNLDSIGWGSPFLLVPEVTNVDPETLENLATASPQDYYLSHASPLGVPFNNFRKSSFIALKNKRIEDGKSGSPCVVKLLQFDTEFTTMPICTASKKYQKLKLKQLKETALSQYEYDEKSQKILEKECLCEGLAAPALINNNIKCNQAVTICPGPNLAFFSGTFTLENMINHIYGRLNILNNLKRPNLFINELNLYLNYFKTEVVNNENIKDIQKINFKKNLQLGID
ncbi:MAG: hypothetical protein KA275_07905, partial [Chitinophagaceae bacterium]|nr:hypothetical protein [Chitinophagaceae bacterium]